MVFALDGVTYEMDQSVLNGATLRGIFEPLTPTPARSAGPRSKTLAKPATDRDRTQAVRKWYVERASRYRVADAFQWKSLRRTKASR